MTGPHKQREIPGEDRVAANGLLDRRMFLRGSAAAASIMGYGLAGEAHAEGLPIEPWMQKPADPAKPYDTPSRFEAEVIRRGDVGNSGFKEVGTVRTPLHALTGTITPGGLHYTRFHTGIPDIDPERHRLLIHGLVKRPLIF